MRLPFITIKDFSTTMTQDLPLGSFLHGDGSIPNTDILPSNIDLDFWNPKLNRRGLLGGYSLGQNLYINQSGQLSSTYFDSIQSEEVQGCFGELVLIPQSIPIQKIQQLNYGCFLPHNLSIKESISESEFIDRSDSEIILFRQNKTIEIKNNVLVLKNREQFLPKPNIIYFDTESILLTPHTSHVVQINSSRNFTFNEINWSLGDISSVSNKSENKIFIIGAKLLGREIFLIKPGEVFRILYVGDGFFNILKTFSTFSIVDQSSSFYRPENPNFFTAFSELKMTENGIKFKTKNPLNPNQKFNLYNKETGEEVSDEDKESVNFPLDGDFSGAGGGGGGSSSGGEMDLLEFGDRLFIPNVEGEYPTFELVIETEKDGRVEKSLVAEIKADSEKFKTELSPDFIKLNTQGFSLFRNDIIPVGSGLLNFKVNNNTYPPNSTASVVGFGTVCITAMGDIYMKNVPGLTFQVPIEYTAGNKYQSSSSFVEISDLNLEGSTNERDLKGSVKKEDELIIINVDLTPNVQTTGNLKDFISLVGINLLSVSDGIEFNVVNNTTSGSLEIFSNGLFRVNFFKSDFWYITTDSEYTIELNFIIPSSLNPPIRLFTLSDVVLKYPLSNPKSRFYVDGAKVSTPKLSLDFIQEQDFFTGNISRVSNKIIFDPDKSVGRPVNSNVNYFEGSISGDLILYSMAVRKLIDFRVPSFEGYSAIRITDQPGIFNQPQFDVFIDKIIIGNISYSTQNNEQAIIPVKDVRNNTILGTLTVNRHSMGIFYQPISSGKHPKSCKLRFYIENYGFKDYVVNLFFPSIDIQPPTIDVLPKYEHNLVLQESNHSYCPSITDYFMNYVLTDGVDYHEDIEFCTISDLFLTPIDYDPVILEIGVNYCEFSFEEFYTFPTPFILSEYNTGYCPLNIGDNYDELGGIILYEYNFKYCPLNITEYYVTPNPVILYEYNTNYCPLFDMELLLPNLLSNSSYDRINSCTLTTTTLYTVSYTLVNLYDRINSCTLTTTTLYTVSYTLVNLYDRVNSCTQNITNLYAISFTTLPEYTSINYCEQSDSTYFTFDQQP